MLPALLLPIKSELHLWNITVLWLTQKRVKRVLKYTAVQVKRQAVYKGTENAMVT